MTNLPIFWFALYKITLAKFRDNQVQLYRSSKAAIKSLDSFKYPFFATSIAC